MKSKVVKRVAAGFVGAGAIAGTLGAVVACGATTYDKRLYYETAESFPVTTGLTGTDNLTLWVSYSMAADSKDVPVTEAIVGLLKDAGLNVTTTKAGDGDYVGYTTAANTWQKYVVNPKDHKLLPDIVINYPDLQAVIARQGLAYSYGSESDMKKIIAPSLFADATSVFTSQEGIYALPLLKSTELTYFDVVNFARLFSDIAAQKGATDTFKVPANSAQDRMIRMILATPEVDGSIKGIYADSKGDSENKNIYTWSDLTKKWNEKTTAGGIWEKDVPVVNTSYTLNNESKSSLLEINWEKPIFTSYDETLNFAKILRKAYTPVSDAFIGGIDSTANILYSYDFQKGGSVPENFYTRIKKSESFSVLEYDFRESIDGKQAPLYSAAQYMSDLVASKAIVARDLTKTINVRGTKRLSQHKLFFTWESTSQTENIISKDISGTNAGDLYYDLQPSKTSLSDTKQAVINQGPSILVTTVHGADTAKKIADAIKKAYEPGGKLVSKWVDNADTGPLAKGGYMYANVTDNAAGSALITGLESQIQSTSTWGVSIGKYLMSKFFKEAATDTSKVAFVNPAGPSSSGARRTFDNVLLSAFNANNPSNGADLVQKVINTFVPDSRLK